MSTRDESGRIGRSAFQAGGDPRRGSGGINPWQHRPPVEVPAPAATPAAAMTASADRLTQVHDGGRLANRQEEAEFEEQLNRAITAAGTDKVAGVSVLGGPGRQPPETTALPDPGELARRMRQAEEQLARGGPNDQDVDALVEGYDALARSDPSTWLAASKPEPGTLAARIADLEQRAQGELDPAAAFALDNEISEALGELNAEVRKRTEKADPFGIHGEPADPGAEELLERARKDPLSVKAGSGSLNSEPSEQDRFERALNERIHTLGRRPELGRPALPEPPAKAAKPTGQAGGDSLANASPEAILAALDKLGVTAEQLAGLVAGTDSEGAR
jgi:hypothetical protein